MAKATGKANTDKSAQQDRNATPMLLSYERSVHPTDGVFRSKSSKEEGTYVPVPVGTKAVLGTQSQYETDPRNVKGGGNPQRIEVAAMPPDHDLLAVSWGLAVTGSSLAPHACDKPVFRDRLVKFMSAYAEVEGFRTISERISANILNGRWLWRNRLMASSLRVEVAIAGGATVAVGNSFAIPLDTFDGTATPDITAVGTAIAAALRGEGLARMIVTGYAELAAGSMVYPSQEFADAGTDKSEVKKFLFSVRADGCPRAAAFHEQKIGNALRTFDTWHGGDDECGVLPGSPLAVNPYGQDRASQGIVRRGGRTGGGNANFYDLMKNDMDRLIAEVRSGTVGGDAHVVAANLIRGGVFGYESKKKRKEAEEASETAEAA